MTVSESSHHLNRFLKEGNKSQTYCIDVCQSDGNLLVLGGTDKNVKIFDKRQSDIVKTFEDVHSGKEFHSIVHITHCSVFLTL